MTASAAGTGDERKVATVLFADLAGSTALADVEDPERVRARLERFYAAMGEEIALAGGTIEKFAGDAVMAVFGAPAAQEDHAERALHASLAMRRRLREVFGDELALRVGVNTGDVVVGAPREGSSFVSGDGVNVAARLEQAAEPGDVLAGERTVAAVRGAFEFDEPQTIEARGKPGGVACRRLVRALSLQRPRGVGGLRPAFVGRDGELHRLRDAYGRSVASRAPCLVTVVGDAGVGKTRLIRELWQWLAAQEPQPFQRTGRCLGYGQATYWALGEILREHFGLLESDTPEQMLERLGEREILGLALGLDVAGGLHPLVARDRFQDAWVELLDSLAAERPGVVLVEDLHRADEPLFDVVEQLAERVRGPLLLIATARPELQERRPGFGTRAGGETIVLEPLGADASGELLEQLLGSPPPVELTRVVAGTEGNPFFLEEVLGSLIDRGLLVPVDAAWALHEPPEGFAVPDTVQAVVAARIDLLDPAEKAALQAASLIGRVFWSGPVYELLDGLEPDLRVLEERDFVHRRAGSAIEGEREYAIKHAVTREVAYESIPKARRARLQAAFAAWLERFGGGRDEHATLLAHHYAEAARPEDADLAWAGEEQRLERLREQAASWLERAARLAVTRYDIEEALAYLHRALDYADAAPERARIWRLIGGANAFKFDGEAFWTAMQHALELADGEQAADVYSELAFHTVIRSGMWRTRPQPERVDVWIDRALELAEPGSPARVRALTARGHWHQGDDESAREASRLADELDDPELRSYAWMARSSAAFHNLRFEEAWTWAWRRFDVSDEIEDPDQVLEIYESAIPTAATMTRIAEARELAARHGRLAARLTPHHRMHTVALTTETEEAAADWAAIRELRPRIEKAVEENADTPCVRNARSLLVCAVAHEIGGDPVTAGELERATTAVGFATHSWALVAPRIRLAVIRRDPEALQELLAQPAFRNMTFGPAQIGARMDGLALVHDRERIEAEAPPLLQPGTMVEPFALRALGIARNDDALVDRADERFAVLGLEWHRSQTATLRDGL